MPVVKPVGMSQAQHIEKVIEIGLMLGHLEGRAWGQVRVQQERSLRERVVSWVLIVSSIAPRRRFSQQMCKEWRDQTETAQLLLSEAMGSAGVSCLSPLCEASLSHVEAKMMGEDDVSVDGRLRCSSPSSQRATPERAATEEMAADACELGAGENEVAETTGEQDIAQEAKEFGGGHPARSECSQVCVWTRRRQFELNSRGRF